ncbi:site-specific tyrosine recombinase XerD [Sinanaerobacter chloroacetimidivorans]|jgi:integrase/recombinase XerD|uniref:Tyrosine recombinase XerC n=1 Tax=Sinanaerobacter chloroacetimidivorans TaxID=2818044 RepID=A0A8J8B0Q2_9FIRM|nr:site-specific tyrosine recombinase XerD [Sinanaerobacter chloroacetimidivorans]MBR0596861.1 site-specific tyrosine recombinase XerD [Sinanaerobacter chloroacetimidivorans]
MDRYLNEFMQYLKTEKKMAKNSLEAYQRDILEFCAAMGERGITDLTQISNTEVVAYLLKLKNEGKSAATVNRKVASLRGFYQFMTVQNYITLNPTINIKSPKIERKNIEYLSLEEVDRLLQQPDQSVKGKRDRAILELLYATGLRVSEIIEMNVEDVNLRMGFVACTGEHGKARIIPMGRPARAAVEEYIYEIRSKLIHQDQAGEKALFLNYSGGRFTRQGLWKLLKEYARLAGIENKLTPQTLRNSFAVHMIQNGADLKSLQELLGHEDITATQIYLSVSKNRIKEVYDKTHPRA